MKTKIQDMTSGSPGRLIILFAIPLMLGNICQQLYTMVDTMVVGQVAGVEALAALGAVDFLMWVVTGISTGLTQGFSIQLSQYYGAKDFENLRKSLAHSYRLTAFIAAGTAGRYNQGVPRENTKKENRDRAKAPVLFWRKTS